jgi:hypothetical protein
MPPMGEWRDACGCSPGKLSICSRISGEPGPAVGAHRHGFLSPRLRLNGPRAEAATVRAAAVPLREAAAGRRAQDPDEHSRSPREATAPGPARGRTGAVPCRLDGRALEAVVLFPVEVVLVGVDLGVHLDLDEIRCFPGHIIHLREGGPGPTTREGIVSARRGVRQSSVLPLKYLLKIDLLCFAGQPDVQAGHTKGGAHDETQ